MSLDFSLIVTDKDGNRITVLDKNITSNLADMAEEAGIYDALWHPEKHGVKYARGLISGLQLAVEMMTHDPERFKKHNSPNGWGLYENFFTFVTEVLEACWTYPSSEISVWI